MAKMIINPNFEKAQNAAYEELKISGGSCFPIEPEQIIAGYDYVELCSYSQFAQINHLSIQDVCEYLASDDGATWQHGAYTIFYNDRVPSINRRRFTIAHELGHVVLNHTANFAFSGSKPNDPLYRAYEQEANYFAKRLLAPLPILYKIADNLPSHTISSNNIASIFEVSEETASYIISNMNALSWETYDNEMCEQYSKSIELAGKTLQIIQSQDLDNFGSVAQ